MKRFLLLVVGLMISLATSAQVASRTQYGVLKLGNNMVDSAGAVKILFPVQTGGSGVPLLTNPSQFATATADIVKYDGSDWYKSPGTVDTNPENNGKYTATQYNAGSSHYDRFYLDWAQFSWWRNSNGSRHNQLRYAISIAGIKLQLEDGTYTFTDNVWTPGNFTVRGNLTDPSKVVFNVTGTETRVFRGWFWYDGVSAGQLFENIHISGITFNQMSTATTNTSYGPITFEGASSRNITVRRCVFNNPSTTAITNGLFIKAGANKLIRDILYEDNVGTGGRIGIEIINQDNHPNNDGTTGYNIVIRRNDMGGYDYNYSIAGNFKNTLIDDNLVGSNTSYGIELAGSNLNAVVSNNRFYGTQNVLIASNYLGENGASNGDYVITGGQKFFSNKTLGYVPGYVEIRGGGDMLFNDNDLNISGGVRLTKTQYGGVVSGEFKNNHIVGAGNSATPGQALLYLEGASNIRATGNTLQRTGSATTAMIQADGSLSTGSTFLDNYLATANGTLFGLTNGASWQIGTNYTLSGVPIQVNGEVLKFGTYAQAVSGLSGRTAAARVLITADEVNYAGGFNKYDYDGSALSTANKVVTNASVASTYTIDLSQADNTYAYITLTGNTTLTITGSAPGKNLYLRVAQGGAGSFTLTFPSSVRFPGGAAVDWNTAAGSVNTFSIVSSSSTAQDGWYSKQ